MNRLFVAYKPAGVSSNRFLTQLKRKYGVKKAGYSGTLDPFAKGVLVVGFGSCTKLFRFLQKKAKTYRATLWLGLKSASLDTENVLGVEHISPFGLDKVQNALFSLKGKVTYTPPKYCAKSVNGERAYKLAREGKEVELNKITSKVYEISLLHYCHPFVTFEITISEGGYVRSMAELVAKKLGCVGALSMLERVREGAFVYEGEKPLEAKKYLNIEENFYNNDIKNIQLGKKLALEDFTIQKDGTYYVDSKEFISIFTIQEKKVHYELGRVLC